MRGRIRARLLPLAVVLLLLPGLALGESGGVPMQVADDVEQRTLDALDGKPLGDPAKLPLLRSDELMPPELSMPATDFTRPPDIDALKTRAEREAQDPPAAERLTLEELTQEAKEASSEEEASDEVAPRDVSKADVLDRGKNGVTERPRERARWAETGRSSGPTSTEP